MISGEHFLIFVQKTTWDLHIACAATWLISSSEVRKASPLLEENERNDQVQDTKGETR